MIKQADRVRAFLQLPVTDQESAETYIRMLVQHDCVYHLEDNPGDIVNIRTWERLFTADEAVVVALRIRQIYALPQPWLGYDCPIGYMLQQEERWKLTKLSHIQKLRILRTIEWIEGDPQRRREVIAILEWNDAGGDFIDCTDDELTAILTNVQQ